MNISQADYAEMPWHARQRLNERLRRETRALTVELEGLTRIRAKRVGVGPSAETTLRGAVAYLAALPADPDAAAHRVALDRELHRKAVAA